MRFESRKPFKSSNEFVVPDAEQPLYVAWRITALVDRNETSARALIDEFAPRCDLALFVGSALGHVEGKQPRQIAVFE